MWFRSLFRHSKPSPRPVRRPTRHTCARLRVAGLEDRSLPSGGVSLAPDQPAPQLVGTAVTWTATAPDAGASPVYQFSVGAPGGPFEVVRDFSPDDHFTWTPIQQGLFRIRVAVKDGFEAADTQSAVVTDEVDPRATGGVPVVSPTANPLVALFSAPPGPVGTVHVEFAAAGDNPSWQSTNDLPSLPSRSTNFLVAGMLPDTTYEMRDVFSDGTASAPLLFTTGAIPSTVKLPAFTVVQPPGPGSDFQQGLVFQQIGNPAGGFPSPLATDLAGNVVWYYDLARAGLHGAPAAGADLLPGGNLLITGADSHAAFPTTQNVLREIDLAGDTLRETNMDVINAQLTAMGHEIVYSLTHDVERLPDGRTAVIGLTERSVTINGTPTDYIGADVIVLDKNLQVAWVWDSFDHLDVNRGPVLGEIVPLSNRPIDPSAAVPDLPAVDWLHANSVNWSPADGNLTLSLRNQDWVIKIAYQNGAGDGHVVWRLGQGGDFTVNSTDPSPWFSGQHDAHYIDASTMIVFDDGDTRRASDPTAHSRGQVWNLDEQTMTATLVFNADLGNYSDALGSAQRLSNGNYVFDSGRQGAAPNQIGQSIEVQPDGSKAYVLQVSRPLYRSFRVQTLYGGISDQVATDGPRARTVPHNEPRIRISDVKKREGGAGHATRFTFTFTLSAASPQPVTVSFQTADDTATTSDSDYVARSGTVTFAPGETTKTIAISVIGDSKREADETFYVELFGNSSNSLFTKSRGIGTILNDD